MGEGRRVMSRRDFLAATALGAGMVALAGCSGGQGGGSGRPQLADGECYSDQVELVDADEDGAVTWAIGYPNSHDVIATRYVDGRLTVEGSGGVLRFMHFESGMTSPTEDFPPWWEGSQKVASAEVRQSVYPACAFGWFSSEAISDWPTWGGLTALPSSVTKARALFSGSSLAEPIPVDLLSGCASLEDLSCAFKECRSLTGPIPEGLLSGRSSLRDLSEVFSWCTSLAGPIPEGLLSGCSSLEDLSGAFEVCTSLAGPIPGDLLSGCPSLGDLSYAFAGCTSLTGPVPADLVSGCAEGVDLRRMFYGCTGIREVAAGFSLPQGVGDTEGMFSDSKNGDGSFEHDPIPTVYEGDDPVVEALLFDGTNRVRSS